MQSTILLTEIKPVLAVNPRRGVPAPVTLMISIWVPAIHIAGGGNSDVENPNGTPDIGARRGFGHCLMKIDPWAAGENARPSSRPPHIYSRGDPT